MKIDEFIQKIKLQCTYIDRVYWLLFGVLIIVAILSLFSASSTLAFAGDSTLNPILNQMLFILVGVVMAFGIQFVPRSWIRVGGYVGLIVSIVLLILTYTSMGVEINGAKRWLDLGPIRFQPSELAKLTLLIVVSDLLSQIKNAEDEKKYFFIVVAITGVVCMLIFFNNLSTTLLLGGVVLIMFFLARVKFKYWGTLLGIVLLLLTGGYFIVKKAYIEPGRKIEAQLLKRVVTWVNRVDNTVEEWKSPADQKYSLEDDYQRTIAKVAIAHGGASPFGVLPGNSTERNFLPQAFADYIFAIIVEESGIVGALFLMFIYLAILFRSCLISSKYAEYSAMLMVMGLALMLTCQALVSMMVSVGIGPVTGQPLPMISRGGTSALVTSLYFGILMCVSREQKELQERQLSSIVASEEDVPDIQIDN